MPADPRTLLASLLLTLLPAAAGAQAVLPPAEYRALVAEGNTANQGRSPGEYRQGGASLSLLAFPQATAIGRASSSDLGIGAGFEGGVAYSFTVDGPAFQDYIPMWVGFALQASVTGGGPRNATAAFSLAYTSNDLAVELYADATNPDPAAVSRTHSFGLLAGQRGDISVFVSGGAFAGSAFALADPYIYIDPVFLAGHPGYSVRVSEGVGNALAVTAVPEPGTYALMLLGLGALGAAARRRRRAGAAPALLLATGLLAGAGAQAQQRPVEFNLQAERSFTSVPGSIVSGAFTATGGLGPTGPEVSVRGVGTSSIDNALNRASASALWEFRIGGPPGVVVPILINGSYRLLQTGNGAATAGLATGGDPFRLNYDIFFRCQPGISFSDCGSHDFELAKDAFSGSLGYISIVAGGFLLGGASAAPGSFDAMMDPLIRIDPSFARAAEFTLSVSPGANGFVAAVPEPGSYALLLAGLGMMGVMAPRRRRH